MATGRDRGVHRAADRAATRGRPNVGERFQRQHTGMVSGRRSGRDQSGPGTIGSHAILTYLRPNRHDGSESRASLASTVALHAGVTSYPTIASMSASIRDRLIALALYRMA